MSAKVCLAVVPENSDFQILSVVWFLCRQILQTLLEWEGLLNPREEARSREEAFEEIYAHLSHLSSSFFVFVVRADEP
jgi:hypothetical protein